MPARVFRFVQMRMVVPEEFKRGFPGVTGDCEPVSMGPENKTGSSRTASVTRDTYLSICTF